MATTEKQPTQNQQATYESVNTHEVRNIRIVYAYLNLSYGDMGILFYDLKKLFDPNEKTKPNPDEIYKRLRACFIKYKNVDITNIDKDALKKLDQPRDPTGIHGISDADAMAIIYLSDPSHPADGDRFRTNPKNIRNKLSAALLEKGIGLIKEGKEGERRVYEEDTYTEGSFGDVCRKEKWDGNWVNAQWRRDHELSKLKLKAAVPQIKNPDYVNTILVHQKNTEETIQKTGEEHHKYDA
ncbi:MAG: hypothetical protein PHS02_01450 [Candidatus ainarchaeum sp.]|nr:hypothetical protein [Candidatus ainarchaeum sp.]